MKDAIARSDKHNDKIKNQKGLLKKLAIDWENAGEINESNRIEIFGLADNVSFALWRPLLYIIPTQNIQPSRIQIVPIENRASSAPEYVIKDLMKHEFDVIEF